VKKKRGITTQRMIKFHGLVPDTQKSKKLMGETETQTKKQKKKKKKGIY